MKEDYIIKDTKGYFGDDYKDIYINLASIVTNILQQIPKHHKMDFLREIGCDEDVTEVVVDRLIGANTRFSNSADSIQQLRLLEKSYLNDSYNKHSKILNDIKSKIKQIGVNDDLYYKLYHDDTFGEWFQSLINKRSDLQLNSFTKEYTNIDLEQLHRLSNELVKSIPKFTDDEYELLVKMESDEISNSTIDYDDN